jgi:hypothetical protein
MRCLVLPLVLFAAHPALGQQRGTDADQWRALVAQLADPTKRDFAIAEMDKLGPEALRRLIGLADVLPRDRLLHAVSELAHHADGALPELCGLLNRIEPEQRTTAMELRLCVMPFVRREHVRQLLPGVTVTLDCLPGPDSLRRSGAGSRLDPDARLLLSMPNIDDSVAELAAALDSANGLVEVAPAKPAPADRGGNRREAVTRRPLEQRQEVAARLLGLRGAEAAASVPPLLRRLRRADGVGCRWTAVALTRIAPDTAAALEAHGYLARHGNPQEFRRAIEAIRRSPRTAGDAVPHLLRILVAAVLRSGGSTTRTVSEIGDVIATLGILGATAKAALPLLQQIAEGDDKRLAEVARAAIRAIEAR